MKLVFVQPKVGYHGVSYWDCLGIGYIIASVKQHMPNATVEFYSGAFDTDQTIINACTDSDYVGFGCTSPQMHHALHLASQIKTVNPQCRTIFGGWHPTAQPIHTLTLPTVDYVIAGEAEHVIIDIINDKRRRKSRKHACNLHAVKPISHLDDLPFPDRDAIKVERHIQLAYRENGLRITSIQGGRGCPFQCSFCSEHLMSHHQIRRRTPRLLIDEIEYVVDKYRIDFLKFVDPEINASIPWVKQFCRELIKREVKVEFEANLHAALVDREMLVLMKDAGFVQVDIGVETGSPKLLKAACKGVTVAQIRKVFAWAREVGLKRRGYFMVGFPHETLDDVEQTFQLAEELEPDVAGMTILCPFPGTNVYDAQLYANVDWATMDEYSNDLPPCHGRILSNDELRVIQQRFRNVFQKRLCYRLQNLS